MPGHGVHRALDRLRFGPRRTLNVRDGGLTATEAARRVDGWLRGKQVELTGEVLVITGRGAGSVDGIAVVREATHRTLHRLKRAGVISTIQEDTPGSFVVALSPLRALLEAPVRRRHSADNPPSEPTGIHGIDEPTRSRLRELAIRALESLGVVAPADSLVRTEMERQFSLLLRGRPLTANPSWLRGAVERSLTEYEEG
jgi:hypothetical protein